MVHDHTYYFGYIVTNSLYGPSTFIPFCFHLQLTFYIMHAWHFNDPTMTHTQILKSPPRLYFTPLTLKKKKKQYLATSSSQIVTIFKYSVHKDLWSESILSGGDSLLFWWVEEDFILADASTFKSVRVRIKILRESKKIFIPFAWEDFIQCPVRSQDH
jgi:hypothetical protein